MKNVALLQSTKTESPKTPGGISKSLLTPCRRIGLSRNWKKAGSSPFISPVHGSTQNNFEVKDEKKHNRKRKEPVTDDENENLQEETLGTTESKNVLNADESGIAVSSTVPRDIDSTPIRRVALPRKKKSKFLADKDKKSDCKLPLKEVQSSLEKPKETVCAEHRKDIVKPIIDTLSTTSPTSLSIPKKCTSPKDIEVKENTDTLKCNIKEESVKNQKYPINLTKESVVVIQKKIFKTEGKDLQTTQKEGTDLDCINKPVNTKYDKTVSQTLSQTLSDSDSDDAPLCNLNKKETENGKSNLEPQKQPEIINLIEDDDFTGTKIVKVAKLVDKNTSTGGLRPGKVQKQKVSKPVQKIIKTTMDSKAASQNSFEDDDDFEFETKRTILIRKTYDKPSKPVKAKTTGSITQKDIDDLKARIEIKKKVLLANAMTEETRELRDLIKKWQKGCQDALAELMDLMKTKCPDKQHMNYAEILQMLKIPSNLVGYNAEDDCFNTPDDASIVLSKFDIL